MDRQLVLVLNAGSSSLKASVLEVGRITPLASTSVAWGSDATLVTDRRAGVRAALGALREAGIPPATVRAVGHRVVHGGERFRSPVLLDDGVLGELESLVELAPLHNSVAIATARAAREALTDVPHVAAFDTAFHATLPDDAYVYPLPWRWHAELGVRKYGFHGLSVAWSVRRAAELLDRPASGLSVVVAHLGSGCSVTAVEGGQSVATSMGMTPLEGLMMGTRAGSFDPGVMLRLLDEGGPGLAEVAWALDHASGLLGISGVGGDVREVEASADGGNPRAALALRMFARRAAEGIGAASSALTRLDALVFTGGIGEHAAAIRSDITGRLAVLGIEPVNAEETGVDRVLSGPGARVAVLRIEAREDVVIAEAVADLLSWPGAT